MISENKKYLQSCINQHRQFINSFMESLLQDDTSPQKQSIRAYLQLIQSESILGPKKIEKYKTAAPEMARIINEAVNQYLSDFPESLGQFYSSIANRNKELMVYLKKENQSLSYEEANTLAKIDILSFYFKANHQYRSKCVSSARLWHIRELSELFLLKAEKIERLESYFLQVEDFLTFSFATRIKNLINVFTIMKISYRTLTLNKMKNDFAKEYYLLKKQKFSQQREIMQNKASKKLYDLCLFNFSELIVVSQEKEQKLFNPNDQQDVLKKMHLIKIAEKQRRYNEQKQLILTLKACFPACLQTIFSFLIKMDYSQDFEQFFEPRKYMNLGLLQLILQYQLGQYKTLEQGIKKCQLNTRFCFKYVPTQPDVKCPRQVFSSFVNVAIRKYKNSRRIVDAQLQMHAKIMPILAITVHQIPYQYRPQQASFRHIDQGMTLIIGTESQKVVFYACFRFGYEERRFFRQIKKEINGMPKHMFVAVLRDRGFGRVFSFSDIRSIRSLLRQKHSSALYITWQNRYFTKNVQIQWSIQMILNYYSEHFTKENFQAFTEAIVNNYFKT